MKDKTAKNAPIALSGRIYVDKFLALKRKDLALPDSLIRGDIKINCLSKEADHAGFLTAYIWDGKGWRKFSLRDKAAVASTYGSNAELLARISDAVRDLKKLKGYEAEWGHKSFVVKVSAVKPAPAAAPSTSGSATSSATSQPAAEPIAATPAEPPFKLEPYSPPAKKTRRKKAMSAKPRRRKRRENPNQTTMF